MTAPTRVPQGLHLAIRYVTVNMDVAQATYAMYKVNRPNLVTKALQNGYALPKKALEHRPIKVKLSKR